MLSNLMHQYNNLYTLFLRPLRAKYYPFQLGDENFKIGEYTEVTRVDFELINKREQTLQCSFYDIKSIPASQQIPCVLFLHCNSGSRLDVKPLLPILLPMGISVATFDFSGSGISDGELISLGYHEVDDVEVMMTFLRNMHRIDPQKIAIWGKSMGGVTALRYILKDRLLAALVIDSAFCSLRRLTMHLAKARTSLPDLILKPFIRAIDKQIQEKAGFSLDDLNLKEAVEHCYTPVRFIASKDDTLVPSSHTEKLFKHYAGIKELMWVRGSHIDNRKDYEVIEIANFLLKYFKINSLKRIGTPSKPDTPIRRSWIPPDRIAKKVSLLNLHNIDNGRLNDSSLNHDPRGTVKFIEPIPGYPNEDLRLQRERAGTADNYNLNKSEVKYDNFERSRVRIISAAVESKFVEDNKITETEKFGNSEFDFKELKELKTRDIKMESAGSNNKNDAKSLASINKKKHIQDKENICKPPLKSFRATGSAKKGELSGEKSGNPLKKISIPNSLDFPFGKKAAGLAENKSSLIKNENFMN